MYLNRLLNTYLLSKYCIVQVVVVMQVVAIVVYLFGALGMHEIHHVMKSMEMNSAHFE